MQEQARHIAGLLYDGILAPHRWFEGLAAFRQAVGALHFHQLGVDLRQGAVLESICSNRNEKTLELYQRHFALIDERVPIVMRMGQGQIMLDHEHFSARHMSRSALYSDCLAPDGMKHTMGLMLRVEGSEQQYVGFIRAVDQQPFGSEERNFALHLLPDMVRAADLRARAGQLARHAALGLAALGTLSQAVAVTDGQGRIQYANAAAEQLLARPGALQARQGLLTAAPPAAAERLQQLLRSACARPARAGALTLQDAAQRLVVTALPLRPDHAWASLAQAPLALVVASRLGGASHLGPRLLGEVLGLSPTEARLALLLAAGKTIKEFAAIEGSSWHTARSHLKNLLRKTGCRRQVELMPLLQSLQGA